LRDNYTYPELLDFRQLLQLANWSDFSPCFTLRAAFAALFLWSALAIKTVGINPSLIINLRIWVIGIILKSRKKGTVLRFTDSITWQKWCVSRDI